jgi:hypothetical protein
VIRFIVALTFVVSMLSCSAETGPATSLRAAASITMNPTSVPTTPSTPAGSTLHWMSFQTNVEPNYRLLYEGGSDVRFTDVRLLAPDGTVVGQAVAVPTANEVMRICGSPATYGPLRATLAVPTQSGLGDVIRRPDAYRVEARIAGEWKPAALVNDCHGQV